MDDHLLANDIYQIATKQPLTQEVVEQILSHSMLMRGGKRSASEEPAQVQRRQRKALQFGHLCRPLLHDCASRVHLSQGIDALT